MASKSTGTLTTGETRERDWYSIPLSSLRRGAVLLGFVLGLVGLSLLYQRWEHQSLRDRAETAIFEATQTSRRLEARSDFEQLRIEHFTIWKDLEDARAELAAGRYRPALDRARASLSELDRLLEAGQGAGGGKSRFVAVQGNVEYRRGERGSWKRARAHDTLNPGDWVKTSSEGTAEIRFPDGAKYVLRRNTMVRLGAVRDAATGREEQVTDLAFGWVELNTAQSSSKVTTPKSEAEVRRDSEALVSFDRERGAGKFTSFRGTLAVVSANGQNREVGELEQVEQVGELLSQPRPLPGRPELLSPEDDSQLDLGRSEAQLAWKPVEGARRYALKVARSPLFASVLVSDEDRRKTTARLGLRGEGIFYWQVAAIDREGARGPWSETRSFRVAAFRGQDQRDDDTPPELEIDEVQAYGSLVIVHGRTEPGAEVKVNDEPVTVGVDGSFRKTIQMTQAGFAFVTIVASDAWDNLTEVKRRVFIDAL